MAHVFDNPLIYDSLPADGGDTIYSGAKKIQAMLDDLLSWLNDAEENDLDLATTAQTIAGTLTTKATHPAGVKAAIEAALADDSMTFAGTADTANYLGTEDVGSGTTLWYLDDGSPTASTSSVGSGTKLVYLSNGTITASSSTVGSSKNPVYLSSGTIKASSSTVGSGTKPIYLSSGTITASGSTVGSATQPVYMSSGTLTASSSTVGSTSKPVYLNSGILTACSSDLTSGVSSSTLESDGYAVFTNGLQICWGQPTYQSAAQSRTVTFAKAFKEVYQIVASASGSSSSYNQWCNVLCTSLTETGATLIGGVGSGDSEYTYVTIRYIAIGKSA